MAEFQLSGSPSTKIDRRSLRNLDGAANPNWKGGSISKACERCGAGFTVKYGRRASGRFCSLPCFNDWQREAKVRWRGPGPYRSETKRPTKRFFVACEWCYRAFCIYPCNLGRKRFCTPKCQRNWRSGHFRADRNPNWNGGSSRLPYAFNWAEISRTIRRRDGDRCLGPGCRGDDPRIVVHHIDYDKSHCEPSNLIAVCSSCNTRANFRRARWKRVYTAIMQERGLA